MDYSPRYIHTAIAVEQTVVVTPIYGAFIPPADIEATLQGFNGFHPIGRV